MNNWKLKRIDSVVDIRRGASPRPIDAYLSDEGMPWVKISDATASPGRFIHRTQQCIKESGVKNSVIVNPEDLIIWHIQPVSAPLF
jgi:type I restriction enzyme S subunit